jgi:hypothetical protein
MRVISREDIDFMLEHLEMPLSIYSKLRRGEKSFCELSPDEIDLLHDLCGDRLQTHGFDLNYDLTEEGEILEALIDKLYKC